MFKECLENVRKNVPLVHNITNYVTVNDVANVLLACGGSPIMSDDIDDVVDITSICGGLNINIGTLNKNTSNICSFFLEKSLRLAKYVALVFPKFLLNTPEFSTTRAELAHSGLWRKGLPGHSGGDHCHFHQQSSGPGQHQSFFAHAPAPSHPATGVHF